MNTPQTCVCGHLKAFHAGLGCRYNGCSCEGYRDPNAPLEEETQGPTRRVTFEIPTGYMLTVSLVPYEAAPVETPVEPEATDG